MKKLNNVKKEIGTKKEKEVKIVENKKAVNPNEIKKDNLVNVLKVQLELLKEKDIKAFEEWNEFTSKINKDTELSFIYDAVANIKDLLKNESVQVKAEKEEEKSPKKEDSKKVQATKKEDNKKESDIVAELKKLGLTKKDLEVLAQEKKDSKKEFSFINDLTIENTSYKRVDTTIDMEYLEKNVNDILIATKWTKSDLKEYQYNSYLNKSGQPKEFNNDIDLLSIVSITKDKKTFIAVSIETGYAFVFTTKSLESLIFNGLEYKAYKMEV